MRRSSGVLALTVAGAVLAACAGPAQTAVPSMGQPQAGTMCGSEEVVHGTGINVDGRRCLLNAFLAAEPALFVSNAVTVEGAPIIRTYRVSAGGGIEVEHDARQDPLGSGRIETLRCDGLVPVADWNEVMGGDQVSPDEVFVEENCNPAESR